MGDVFADEGDELACGGCPCAFGEDERGAEGQERACVHELQGGVRAEAVLRMSVHGVYIIRRRMAWLEYLFWLPCVYFEHLSQVCFE